MAPDVIPVTFDRSYSEYDKKRQAVIFYAYQGGQGNQDGLRITCYISREALLDCFKPQGDAASVGDNDDSESVCLRLFEQQRPAIEATVVRYIQSGITSTYRREDGVMQTEVLLRRKDFC